MKTTLQLEEITMLGLGIYLYTILPYPWWLFLALFLTPDIGMLGYIFNSKIGAITYNIFHHKGVAILIYLAGIFTPNTILQLCGVILFAHASFDRILGYGLKYEKGFKFTHLSEVEKNN